MGGSGLVLNDASASNFGPNIHRGPPIPDSSSDSIGTVSKPRLRPSLSPTACTCEPHHRRLPSRFRPSSFPLEHQRPFLRTFNPKMSSAIPAITGKLRKRLILDLSVAIGGGVALGYGYWYGVHIPQNQRRDAYYLKYQQERGEA
ncbi:hypothetical protein A4X13_0g1872 [Tilletia indica]|uniref:Cytochrome c oxidase polypeptide VIIA n=1 Tax=Tilletia indica TaxID=43049 RepID=A0A177TH02_9BASI|nr:hypothetical protein A4X13_0g1872 [Tilletia indica]